MTKASSLSRRRFLGFCGAYAWTLVLAGCSKGFRYDNSSSAAYAGAIFDDNTLFDDATYYV